MKLSVNAGVREAMQELLEVFERHDSLVRIMANRQSGVSAAMDACLEKQAVEREIVSAAARLLSHATRGKLYPLMTEKTYGPRVTRWL